MPFQKGYTPWNKNKKGWTNSGSFKKGCNTNVFGKHWKISEQGRINNSKSKSGNKHWRWMGGIENKNKRIRKGIEFRLWRETVFARDHWTCQECGQRGGILHPHHVKSFAKFIELRFAIDNGRTLCKKCHNEIHKKKYN